MSPGTRTGFVRAPAVAGRFYAADPDMLAAEVAAHLGDTSQAASALGLVAPHAGYVYSGKVAGKTFARTHVPSRVIVLAPNHTGRGQRVSVLPAGVFRVPTADVPINDDLVAALLKALPGAERDAVAHEYEHAAEVEVPFLFARRADVEIAAVVLGHVSLADALALGQGLAEVVAETGALVVASSDMNHYLPEELTRARDKIALAPLLALDPEGLYRTVEREDLSMCGYIPTTVMLACARARGARTATLVDHGTSADAFGDRARTVGYAGVVVA